MDNGDGDDDEDSEIDAIAQASSRSRRALPARTRCLFRRSRVSDGRWNANWREQKGPARGWRPAEVEFRENRKRGRKQQKAFPLSLSLSVEQSKSWRGKKTHSLSARTHSLHRAGEGHAGGGRDGGHGCVRSAGKEAGVRCR